MTTKERIELTEKFLKEELEKSITFKDNTRRSVDYRYEHSLRVANIGVEIAKVEGFDQEKMCVACLLHDIGYSVDFFDKDDYKSHGRIGASIARPFLETLGYSKQDVDEMCYGIAIHVDDKADFEFEKTPFSLTIGDADNIDRFDAFRLYESFHLNDYRNKPIEEQKETVVSALTKLKKFKSFEFGTKTANTMWNEKLDYQISFYEKLLSQIINSNFASILEKL
jgi:uncharacterized protein